MKLIQTWRRIVVLVTTLFVPAPEVELDSNDGIHTLTMTDLSICQIAMAPRYTLSRVIAEPVSDTDDHVATDIAITNSDLDTECVLDVEDIAVSVPVPELDYYAS